ncbi:4a-hydroxytetrahydrobiopterin dehydratase [Actinomarinicola tropica]|uniref:4a-hydroxytetrahydrobiopterin dehydratase n=1 Tax=Actinomarinicola tropica TaxID=2789776 RepID=UPI0018973EFF|nr:4a-hydroxytetrahydrobiopterin dehydratase [Actinomarinicola tropica]
MDRRRITAEDVAATEALAGWTVDGELLRAELRLPSFAVAGRLVAAVAELADAHDHHPDLSLAYPGVVTVELTSHDVGHLTPRDLDLATEIAARAAAMGAEPAS